MPRNGRLCPMESSMTISSRTPEGLPNQCPVCGKKLVLEPSRPQGDAPCPHCGCLVWFTLGDSQASPEEVVVRLPKEKYLDEFDLHDLREMVLSLGIGDRCIVLDFANVRFCSSAVLGSLVTLQVLARSKGGQIRIRGVRREIAEVFRITQLAGFEGLLEAFDEE